MSDQPIGPDEIRSNIHAPVGGPVEITLEATAAKAIFVFDRTHEGMDDFERILDNIDQCMDKLVVALDAQKEQS